MFPDISVARHRANQLSIRPEHRISWTVTSSFLSKADNYSHRPVETADRDSLAKCIAGLS